MEKRVRNFEVQLRTGEDLGEGVAEAYVTTWDTEYKIGHNLYEQVDRRAFDVDKPRPLFYEHNWSAGPIGEQVFRADDHGLLSRETYYLDDPRARSVWRGVKAKTLRERSVGFITHKDGIEVRKRADGATVERIVKGDLVESSVVVRGANPETETVSTRAVVPAAAVPAPVDPATGLPAEAAEEEKPTKAALLAKVGEVVELAIELNMADQLPEVLKQYLKILVEQAPPEPVAPAAPGAPAAAPAAPAARSLPEDMSPSLFRALSV